MPMPSPEPWPLADGMQVLDRIEQALTESLARMPSLEPPVASTASAEASPTLAALAKHLAHLQERLDRAEQQAAQADIALAAEAGAVDEWHKRAAEVWKRWAPVEVDPQVQSLSG